MLPVVDIVEIGNGGGSIAWVDDYNKLTNKLDKCKTLIKKGYIKLRAL